MRCCFFVETTALLPMGEIGFVDGLGGEDRLDIRQLVEPGEEVLGQFAVLEALVELLTDGQGEPGDFAVGRHRGPPESVALFSCAAMVARMRQD